MGNDQHDTVGLSGDVEGVRKRPGAKAHRPTRGRRGPRWSALRRARPPRGSHPPDRRGRWAPGRPAGPCRCPSTRAGRGSPSRRRARRAAGAPGGGGVATHPWRGRRVRRGAASARRRRSAGPSGPPGRRRWRSAVRWWSLPSPGPTLVSATDFPPTPVSSCSIEATMRWKASSRAGSSFGGVTAVPVATDGARSRGTSPSSGASRIRAGSPRSSTRWSRAAFHHAQAAAARRPTSAPSAAASLGLGCDGEVGRSACSKYSTPEAYTPTCVVMSCSRCWMSVIWLASCC